MRGPQMADQGWDLDPDELLSGTKLFIEFRHNYCYLYYINNLGIFVSIYSNLFEETLLLEFMAPLVCLVWYEMVWYATTAIYSNSFYEAKLFYNLKIFLGGAVFLKCTVIDFRQLSFSSFYCRFHIQLTVSLCLSCLSAERRCKPMGKYRSEKASE